MSAGTTRLFTKRDFTLWHQVAKWRKRFLETGRGGGHFHSFVPFALSNRQSIDMSVLCSPKIAAKWSFRDIVSAIWQVDQSDNIRQLHFVLLCAKHSSRAHLLGWVSHILGPSVIRHNQLHHQGFRALQNICTPDVRGWWRW